VDYLDCVENVVVSFCGTEAGAWQRELDERALRPFLAEINCPALPCKGGVIISNETFIVQFFRHYEFTSFVLLAGTHAQVDGMIGTII
jgi:hypothetical protein